MNEWKKVKIRDFLTERGGRYKPNDPKISKYRRLDKIDFSGEIHISDKPTKTDMILVQPGDLVISGINVAKGAITVYQGAEPICATIHYSAYTFDDSIADLEFFKYFVKSPAFVETLKQQIKGGIKTEIKPKHLLPLEISIPNLNIQKQIVAELSKKLNAVKEFSIQISKQKEYIKSLRANILQDAIEGKLTVSWRKQNPTIKGDFKFDAEALYEQIQKERSNLNNSNLKSKKSKFEPIAEDEKPFEIPKGWKWVRMGEVIEYTENLDIQKKLKETDLIKYVDIDSIDNHNYEIRDYKEKTVGELSSRARRVLKKDYIIYSTVRPYLCNIAIIKNKYYNYIGSTGFNVFRTIGTKKEYVFYFLLSDYIINLYKDLMQGFNSPSINNQQFENTLIPLPPLKEQEEIVNKVETLLAKVATLENQIAEREQTTKQLMQSILKDAFEER